MAAAVTQVLHMPWSRILQGSMGLTQYRPQTAAGLARVNQAGHSRCCVPAQNSQAGSCQVGDMLLWAGQ